MSHALVPEGIEIPGSGLLKKETAACPGRTPHASLHIPNDAATERSKAPCADL